MAAALLAACSEGTGHSLGGTSTSSGSGGAKGSGGATSSGATGGATSGGGTTDAGIPGVICPDSTTWTPPPAPAVCADAPPWTTSGTPAVAITVDAGAPLGAWSRFYEKAVASDHANTLLCTVYGRNIQNALRKAHAQAGLQYVRFHGILDDDIGVYSEDSQGAPVYDWRRLDAVYDAIAAAGMKPIVEVSFMPSALASDPTAILTNLWYGGKSPNISPPRDWDRWQLFMADLVKHLEERYGADEVRQNWYFEVWNEPSWMYTLQDPGYVELYQYTVAGLLAGDPEVRVGGPAGSSPEALGLAKTLILRSQLQHLKVDFVSYHRYGNDMDSAVGDANGALTFHRTMAALVKDTAYTGEVINDEFGPSWMPDVSRDNESAASYIAKTIHLLGTDDTAPPPSAYGYWAVSDLYEEIETGSARAYREGNFGLMLKGDPSIPASFDVAKPAFNALRLLHAMTDTRVSVAGGTTGDGVNAVATLSADKNALQVLVYNHATGPEGDPTQSSLVSITVNNIPFAPGPIRVHHTMVDATHANSYRAWVKMNRPSTPTAAQWGDLRDAAELCYYETTPTLTGSSWTVTFPQLAYGVSLIEITRS